MTEKRFVYYEHKGADYILDTPNKSLDFIEMLGDCLEAEEIVDLLNEQHEQIERLKENFRALDEVKCELAGENEKLKQFKEKVFTLIDKEIARNEEAIEWGKETGIDTGAMGFYNHMLKRLKKELEE